MRAQRGDVVTNDELRRVKRCISAGRSATEAAATAARRGIAAQMATTVLDQNLRVSPPLHPFTKKHTIIRKVVVFIGNTSTSTNHQTQISDFGFRIVFNWILKSAF